MYAQIKMGSLVNFKQPLKAPEFNHGEFLYWKFSKIVEYDTLEDVRIHKYKKVEYKGKIYSPSKFPKLSLYKKNMEAQILSPFLRNDFGMKIAKIHIWDKMKSLTKYIEHQL